MTTKSFAERIKQQDQAFAAAQKKRRENMKAIEKEIDAQIVKQVLGNCPRKSFDIDLFCDMMAGEDGTKFYKRFAACYGTNPIAEALLQPEISDIEGEPSDVQNYDYV